MFEVSSVWSTAQEVFAQRNECSKVCDGVGREMVKLGIEKVQETSEQRMQRQGETTVDVGCKEDALTCPRLRLDVVPR